jgi:hypothetical protein
MALIHVPVAPDVHEPVRRKMQAEGIGWEKLIDRLLRGYLESRIVNADSTRATSLAPTVPEPRTGGRRSLTDDLQTVIGTGKMNAHTCYEALKARGSLPEGSDALGLVRHTLSRSANVFARVPGERGVYSVAGRGGSLPETRPPHTSALTSPEEK